MENQGHKAPTFTVPLHDEYEGTAIYSAAIPRLVMGGGLVGGVVIGTLGYLLSEGVWAVAGLGQWSAAGSGPGTFASAGIGVALGALAGGWIAIRKLPSSSSVPEDRSSR